MRLVSDVARFITLMSPDLRPHCMIARAHMLANKQTHTHTHANARTHTYTHTHTERERERTPHLHANTNIYALPQQVMSTTRVSETQCTSLTHLNMPNIRGMPGTGLLAVDGKGRVLHGRNMDFGSFPLANITAQVSCAVEWPCSHLSLLAPNKIRV